MKSHNLKMVEPSDLSASILGKLQNEKDWNMSAVFTDQEKIIV